MICFRKITLILFFFLIFTFTFDTAFAICYKDKTTNSYVSKINGDKSNYEEVDDKFCKSGDNSYNNFDEGNVVRCGGGLLTDIPRLVPKIIHIIYLIIQILVPILLVIFGSIDFLKAVIGQKDDEIKKGQQIFIKRLIYGIIVFFVFSIVRLVISFAADSKGRALKIMDCASCLINNDSKCVAGE